MIRFIVSIITGPPAPIAELEPTSSLSVGSNGLRHTKTHTTTKTGDVTEKGDHPDVRLGLEGRVGAREGLDCAEAIRKVVEAPAEDELVQCAPKRRRLRAANGASVSRERPRKRWVQGFAHSQS